MDTRVNLECDSNAARGKIISEWTLQCPLNRESPLLFTISVHRTGRCALHGSITEQQKRDCTRPTLKWALSAWVVEIGIITVN